MRCAARRRTTRAPPRSPRCLTCSRTRSYRPISTSNRGRCSFSTIACSGTPAANSRIFPNPSGVAIWCACGCATREGAPMPGDMVAHHPDQSLTARRTRLAEIDRDLARLRYGHDIAMSAFRFEEATALGPEIAALEKERQHLAAALPETEPPTGITPVLARLRRRR